MAEDRQDKPADRPIIVLTCRNCRSNNTRVVKRRQPGGTIYIANCRDCKVDFAEIRVEG